MYGAVTPFPHPNAVIARSTEGTTRQSVTLIVCGGAATSFRRQANIVYAKRNIVFRRKPRLRGADFAFPLPSVTLRVTAPPPHLRWGKELCVSAVLARRRRSGGVKTPPYGVWRVLRRFSAPTLSLRGVPKVRRGNPFFLYRLRRSRNIVSPSGEHRLR